MESGPSKPSHNSAHHQILVSSNAALQIPISTWVKSPAKLRRHLKRHLGSYGVFLLRSGVQLQFADKTSNASISDLTSMPSVKKWYTESGTSKCLSSNSAPHHILGEFKSCSSDPYSHNPFSQRHRPALIQSP